ncbi:MAG: HEAT repeat domain-containing protein, partial [Endomicrobiia bacterium]|nr:HEAT repeat domain-containing protein [Endomicrobiia bacterium]
MKKRDSLRDILVKTSVLAVAVALVFFIARSFAVETVSSRKPLATPMVAAKGSPSSASSSASPAAAQKSNEYIEAIYSALKNPSSDMRIRALEIIRERPSVFSASRVKASLDDKDVNVKIQAVRALVSLNDRAGVSHLKTLAFTVSKLSSSPTISERVKYFTAQNNRIKAIAALGDIKDTSSIKQLEDATKDGDARVADAAWMALAKMGNKKGADIFIAGLKSSEKAVRAKSAEAVAELGALEALSALRERMADWDKDVKISAVRSLGILRDAQSAPNIREMILNEKDQSLREAA